MVAASDFSDAELVVRCRANDQNAWRELFGRFSPYVYAIARAGFRLDEEDADEILQEVFARSYQRLDTLRDDHAIRAWVGQLTRRKCLDRVPAQRPEEPLAAAAEIPDDTQQRLEAIEQTIVLEQALDELPCSCRQVIERFFSHDHSYQTIGTDLQLPPGTIASHISRCLDKLRDVLGDRERLD